MGFVEVAGKQVEYQRVLLLHSIATRHVSLSGAYLEVFVMYRNRANS